MWVFKVNLHVDGSISKFKARYAAKGYSQVEGVDLFDPFSPTGKQASFWVFFAMAAAQGWKIEQMDVVSAFSNASAMKNPISSSQMDTVVTEKWWRGLIKPFMVSSSLRVTGVKTCHGSLLVLVSNLVMLMPVYSHKHHTTQTTSQPYTYMSTIWASWEIIYLLSSNPLHLNGKWRALERRTALLESNSDTSPSLRIVLVNRP